MRNGSRTSKTKSVKLCFSILQTRDTHSFANVFKPLYALYIIIDRNLGALENTEFVVVAVRRRMLGEGKAWQMK